MGKLAFIFPGQGSQTVGMGKSLAETSTTVEAIFDRANKRLGLNLSTLIFEGPEEELTLTINAQPALLTTSIAVLTHLQQFDITPDYVAGHSLGEYSALVAAGAFSFEDGVYAVRKRGTYMEEAVPNGEGTMAAILGLERDKLQQLTNEITLLGHTVQLANLNCPGQIVISGTKQGVTLACEQAKQNGAKRAIPLNVSGPFHSELMKPAAEKFSNILQEISIVDAQIPVITNVTATPVATADLIKENLLKQLYSPVLWEDSIRQMLELGVDTFIEIGNGKVLSGLVKKIDRHARVFAVQDEESCHQTVKALRGEGS